MADPEYTVIVLGSAQDGGVPQLGGSLLSGLGRTASSIAIVGVGVAVLVDASPDLRHQQQHLAADPMYASRSSSSAFDAILLTHAHMGHYAGLVHFGKEAHNAARVPCFASARMLAFLEVNEPWATLFAEGNLQAAPVVPGIRFDLGPGLSCIAHSVAHRPDFSDNVGFEILGPKRSVLYLPDLDHWSEWSEAADVLSRVDAALVDATFYDLDEHPSRDLTDIAHPPVTDTISRFAGLAGSTRIILTHLNWTNPLCEPSAAEHATVTEAGFEVAGDGQRLAL